MRRVVVTGLGVVAPNGVAFQRPELIEYRLPVLDRSGAREIAEAGEVAQQSWTAWEQYMRGEGLSKT